MVDVFDLNAGKCKIIVLRILVENIILTMEIGVTEADKDLE